MPNANPAAELRVALVQTDLYWEDATANLAALEEMLAEIETPVDLVILPEMFNSGFTMNSELAEPMNFTTTRWLKQCSAKLNAMIIGSLAVREGGQLYNRVCCVQPDGSLSHYDKRHLFRMGEEHAHYAPGTSRLIISWKGWNICPLVCYDLRFPIWSRNPVTDPYDILIYVANWPARRAHAWNTLLAARAIENQAYVVGVNRIGTDGNGTAHQGDSAVLDYLGEPLLQLGRSKAVKMVKISKSALNTYRASFPAHLDADAFNLV